MFGRLTIKKSYVILGIIVILLSGFSFLCGTIDEAEWVSSYLSNIATGVLGSLIIVFFLDKIVEREREKQRHRIVRMALKRLKGPIYWYMELLCHLFKAAAQNKPSFLPSTFEEVFTDSYYREISFLDFSKNAPTEPKIDWFNHVHLEATSFRRRLEQVEDMYSGSLEVDLFEILEKVVNSGFLKLLITVREAPVIAAKYKKKIDPKVLSGAEHIMREHVTLMLKLVKYYNSKADSPIRLNRNIWNDDVAPQWGSGR